MRLGKSLKAGALQVVLSIAVVVALLLTAFILLVHTHKRFRAQVDFIIETTENANKGIQYALKNEIRPNDSITIDLNDEDFKTLKVYKSSWGIFERVTSVAQIKKSRITKTALIGGALSNTKRSALYLKDNNKPLVVVGNTKIQGQVYLPKQGVKPGTISGQSYYGEQLIYGTQKTSSRFPKPTQLQQHIKALELQSRKLRQEQFLDIGSGNTFRNSFLEPVQILYAKNTLRLDNITLIGHIIVQSKTKIIVSAGVKLTDVVLMAPEIEIQNQVSGQFQAIATQQIYVGQNVTLEYPSALVINEEQVVDTDVENSNTPPLQIDSNSTLKGVLAYIGQPKANNFKVQVELRDNALVLGDVYCNQNLELKGKVYGSVYTDNFITKASGSIYQNHIYNGTIIAKKLPEQFVGLALNTTESNIVKWLY